MTMYQNYAKHYNIKIIKPRLWTNYSPLAESDISLVMRQKWLNHVYQQIFLRNNLIFWYFNWFNLNQRNKIRYHLIKYLKTRISMSACLVAVIIQTLWDPMDYSPPGFSVHGIFQARILEWVDISSSRDRPDPGIKSAPPVSPDCRPILRYFLLWWVGQSLMFVRHSFLDQAEILHESFI